jgi:hypothetical protein
MPGYAIQPDINKPILIVNPDTLEELYENVFYGIKFDPSEGKATIEVIREGEPVSLPESNNYTDFNDYAHWLASSKSINFSWETNKKTHLLMEVI